MYKIRMLHNMNVTPWEMSYEERVNKFNQYIHEGYQVNLIIYEYPDTSTFRYRGYNIYQALLNSDSWRAMFFFQSELKKIEHLIEKVSLVTITRVRWSFDIQNFIDYVKTLHIPVAFDIDDRVFDIDYLPLVVNTLNVNMASERDYDFWFSYISRISLTASKADVYISTNKFLSNALEEKFHKPGFIIPNFINNEQVEISNRLIDIKSRSRNHRPFTIGYFSGTPSHINDFKIIYKEIMQLLIDFKDINLSVVGFMEFPKEMQEFIKKGRITFTSLVDFITLQKLIASVDVNIVPLVINDFTNCKSELKYFEASIVNTITCASPNYTYSNSIEDGKNGFLCRQGQWYEKIKAIYQNQVNVNDIVNNANNYSKETYYGNSIVNSIETCYSNAIIKGRG